jgi:hypothetical protein
VRYVVLFDACVLYSAPLRDFLLRLALTGLFAAKWTHQIQQEWSASLSRARPELADRLPKTISLMNEAIEDVIVTDYEPLIDSLVLPDLGDRHVLAAAIRCGAQAIVTFNLSDFPHNVLSAYGIEAIHPDVFIENQFDLDAARVVEAAKSARASLRNPPKTAEQYIETLANQGLPVSSDRLSAFSRLI